jgi:hypothetical protein
LASPPRRQRETKTVYTGVIGDTMCGTKPMQDTKEADCIHMCIEHDFELRPRRGRQNLHVKGNKNQIDKLSVVKPGSPAAWPAMRLLLWRLNPSKAGKTAEA